MTTFLVFFCFNKTDAKSGWDGVVGRKRGMELRTKTVLDVGIWDFGAVTHTGEVMIEGVWVRWWVRPIVSCDRQFNELELRVWLRDIMRPAGEWVQGEAIFKWEIAADAQLANESDHSITFPRGAFPLLGWGPLPISIEDSTRRNQLLLFGVFAWVPDYVHCPSLKSVV